MNKDSIALHIIKEDLKYHQMVAHLSKVDLHIEFFPDFASSVQALIHPNMSELEAEKWTDKYVEQMSKARNIAWKDKKSLHLLSESIIEILKS